MDFSNVVDTRDIEERIEELTADKELLEETLEDLENDDDDVAESDIADATQELEDWDNGEDGQELKNLLALRADVNSPEWEYGLSLIHENYFTEYCEEMLKDCGEIPQDIPSYLVIDWEATAENLMVDYSSVEYDGDTFYYRD